MPSRDSSGGRRLSRSAALICWTVLLLLAGAGAGGYITQRWSPAKPGDTAMENRLNAILNEVRRVDADVQAARSSPLLTEESRGVQTTGSSADNPGGDAARPASSWSVVIPALVGASSAIASLALVALLCALPQGRHKLMSLFGATVTGLTEPVAADDTASRLDRHWERLREAIERLNEQIERARRAADQFARASSGEERAGRGRIDPEKGYSRQAAAAIQPRGLAGRSPGGGGRLPGQPYVQGQTIQSETVADGETVSTTAEEAGESAAVVEAVVPLDPRRTLSEVYVSLCVSASGSQFETSLQQQLRERGLPEAQVRLIYREASHESTVFTENQSGLGNVTMSLLVQSGTSYFLAPRPQRDGNFADLAGFERKTSGPFSEKREKLREMTPAILEAAGNGSWSVTERGQLVFAA